LSPWQFWTSSTWHSTQKMAWRGGRDNTSQCQHGRSWQVCISQNPKELGVQEINHVGTRPVFVTFDYYFADPSVRVVHNSLNGDSMATYGCFLATFCSGCWIRPPPLPSTHAPLYLRLMRSCFYRDRLK
jgi:hypothetical protein